MPTKMRKLSCGHTVERKHSQWVADHTRKRFGRSLCQACYAERDLSEILQTGKGGFYWVVCKEKPVNPNSAEPMTKHCIEHGPSGNTFPVNYVKRHGVEREHTGLRGRKYTTRTGGHNWYMTERTDLWWTMPDGTEWWGYNISGGNSDYVHARRLLPKRNLDEPIIHPLKDLLEWQP